MARRLTDEEKAARASAKAYVTRSGDDQRVRVFHPTLDSFQDVNTGDLADWTDQGWLESPDPDVHNTARYPALIGLDNEPVEQPPAVTEAVDDSTATPTA